MLQTQTLDAVQGFTIPSSSHTAVWSLRRSWSTGYWISWVRDCRRLRPSSGRRWPGRWVMVPPSCVLMCYHNTLFTLHVFQGRMYSCSVWRSFLCDSKYTCIMCVHVYKSSLMVYLWITDSLYSGLGLASLEKNLIFSLKLHTFESTQLLVPTTLEAARQRPEQKAWVWLWMVKWGH